MTNDPSAELCGFGVAELGKLYRSRQLSPVEVARATLDRIERLNPELNAYIQILPELALAAAKAAEDRFASGRDLGRMDGIPVSVKDVIQIKGARTTAASRVLENAPPDETDSKVVSRLRAAGAVLLGKVNLHEFAFGVPDSDSPFGVVQNPRRIGYQAGSSSSGSAAAVAAGLGVISLGTDTGGSIRYPASMCGVAGLKPTYGLVPLHGVIPLSSRLDHVGPLGRSITDLSSCLDVIAEKKHRAQTPMREFRLGVPVNPIFDFGFPDALAVHEQARRCLIDDLGMNPVSISVPWAERAREIWDIIPIVDLWAYHHTHRRARELYGRSFRDRARSGLRVSAVRYARALAEISEMQRDWRAMFDEIDILCLPGNAGGAPPHGVESLKLGGKDYPVKVICSPHNRASNLTGFPSLVLPVGEDRGGMPVAIQLVAPPFHEACLLTVGRALEEALGNIAAKWGIAPRAGPSFNRM